MLAGPSEMVALLFLWSRSETIESWHKFHAIFLPLVVTDEEGTCRTRRLTREWSRKGREEENAELIGGLSLHATPSDIITTRRDGVAYGHIYLLQTSLTLLLILSFLRESYQLML